MRAAARAVVLGLAARAFIAAALEAAESKSSTAKRSLEGVGVAVVAVRALVAPLALPLLAVPPGVAERSGDLDRVGCFSASAGVVGAAAGAGFSAPEGGRLLLDLGGEGLFPVLAGVSTTQEGVLTLPGVALASVFFFNEGILIPPNSADSFMLVLPAVADDRTGFDGVFLAGDLLRWGVLTLALAPALAMAISSALVVLMSTAGALRIEAGEVVRFAAGEGEGAAASGLRLGGEILITFGGDALRLPETVGTGSAAFFLGTVRGTGAGASSSSGAATGVFAALLDLEGIEVGVVERGFGAGGASIGTEVAALMRARK